MVKFGNCNSEVSEHPFKGGMESTGNSICAYVGASSCDQWQCRRRGTMEDLPPPRLIKINVIVHQNSMRRCSGRGEEPRVTGWKTCKFFLTRSCEWLNKETCKPQADPKLGARCERSQSRMRAASLNWSQCKVFKVPL